MPDLTHRFSHSQIASSDYLSRSFPSKLDFVVSRIPQCVCIYQPERISMFCCQKYFLPFCFIVMLSAGLCGQEPAETSDDPASEIELKPNVAVTAAVDEVSLKEKASYIIGYNMTGRWLSGLKAQGVELDDEKLLEGIKAAVAQQELGMTNEEIATVMQAFEKVAEKQQLAKMTQAAKDNRIEGENYLAENGQKAGVQKLDNGVQYEVLTAGEGDSPSESDTVRIHYHGTLPNGDVFDSTVEPPSGAPSEPAEFTVGQVVPGFSAALQAMKVGDKWKVAIPSDLAYGQGGPGPIGPNRTLVFEIELLEIVK